LKVLLTGASGFVGSHVLDELLGRQVPTVVLLRDSSSRTFLAKHLPRLEIRLGSISQPKTLPPAVEGVTHVIHCAGCTKASRPSDYFRINHNGTANLVDAVNASPQIERFIHVSSLAAIGPATPDAPAHENTPPKPVSDYGKSKLDGELEVSRRCKAAFTIVRPPGVYGPRDTAFLPLFKAVQRHFLPRPAKDQALSLVYVQDLAQAISTCLDHPGAPGRSFFVSSSEIVTSRQMSASISEVLKNWTIPLPLPGALLWSICLAQELISRTTGHASLLNLQKFAELRAPGWVCDPSRLERELGFRCTTTLVEGISRTLEWYRKEQWL
jgi:2-alkyl-3-oxoalkanoate reductase